MFGEDSGVMEKQPPRQNQAQFKNNGTAAERKNDFTPNRNGRQRKWKDVGVRSNSQESSTPSARSNQKWSKPNGDKRPRQRDGYDYRQREEVTEYEDISYEEEPFFSSNSRKGNGNHLLSFQYERRGMQPQRANLYNYARPHKTGYVKSARFNKEQFLQASYQFVVCDTDQYQVLDPDTLVQWELVELVRNLTSEVVKCSICLMTPYAGKITKCGHTFCWACVLHYLSTDESDRQGCPLCHQPIVAEELRSIQHLEVPNCKEGDEIEMTLMRKNKGKVFVCPKAQWRGRDTTPLNISDGAATSFNKVLIATKEQIYFHVIETEKAALAIQMIDAIDYEPGFIAMAQDLLKKREMDLIQKMHTVSESRTVSSVGDYAESEHENRTVSEDDREKTPLPINLSFDGSQITVYADAFENVAISELPLSPPIENGSFYFDPISEEADAGEDSSCTVSEGHRDADVSGLFDPDKEAQLTLEGAESGSGPLVRLFQQQSMEEHNSLTPDEAVDHLEYPMETLPHEKRSNANRSKDVYYFYQASTGQHLYLNSINVQCLVKEYGSMENSPESIKGTVVAIDRIFITEEMRRRFRYLNHLPLTCEIQIVELILTSPLISKNTMKHFQAEFEKRRKMRQRKLKEEKARARKYEAEQEKKNGYGYMGYHIVNSAHFPAPKNVASSPPDKGAATMQSDVAQGTEGQGTYATVSTGPGQDVASSLSPAGSLEESSGMSFAQMLKCGRTAPTAGMAWGSALQRSLITTVASPTLSSPGDTNSPVDPELDMRPPDYAESMRQGLSKVSFMTSPSNEDSPPKTSGGGKKKKKKEKQLVLFSTGMARKN